MKKFYEFFNKNEFVIFCIITFLNAIYVFSFNFYHSLDGPGHLHNSNLLLNILSGNELITEYYRVNSIPVGNWTGNAVLAFFNYLFPASTALSFFLFTYFTGMAFSYRYLIKSLSGTFKPIHYIIFPFFDNSCIGLGLYNFSTSLMVLFFILGFWIRYNQNMERSKWIKFAFLLVLLYFSHFLSFVFFGISLIFFIIYEEYIKFTQHKKIYWKSILIRTGKIAIVSLPSLIFALIYVLSISSTVSSGNREQSESISLLQNIYYVRPLILFHVENDGTRNLILFTGIILIFILALLQSIFRRKQLKENSYNRNYILVLVIIFAILLLSLPPRFLLNTMRIRLTLMFFIVFVIWISMYPYPKWFHVLAALFFIGITIHNKSSFREIYEKMDKHSNEIHAFNNWIEPNSIILPINDSFTWMHENSMSYIGVDKPIINVRNTQAFGFFPVLFKGYLPYTLLGNKTPKEVGFWFYSGIDTTNTKIIDYVLLSNPKELQKDEEKNAKFFKTLSAYYTNIVTSSDSSLVLYKLNKSVDIQTD
jgi:hypothetical protein